MSIVSVSNTFSVDTLQDLSNLILINDINIGDVCYVKSNKKIYLMNQNMKWETSDEITLRSKIELIKSNNLLKSNKNKMKNKDPQWGIFLELE